MIDRCSSLPITNRDAEPKICYDFTHNKAKLFSLSFVLVMKLFSTYVQ